MLKVLLLLLVFTLPIFSQAGLPKEFKSLLKQSKMKLDLPDGYELKKECNDSLALSDICFKHRDKNVEIRIDIELNTEEDKKYPVHKLFDEGSYSSIKLDPANYNATEAGAASFKISEKYNIGYKQCWQVFLFKTETAVANMFVFLDDNDMNDKEFLALITALKFK